jgi:hypothetical protein
MPQQQQPLIPQQQQPFLQPGFNQQQQQFQMPQFQRAASGADKKLPRRRRQMNLPSNPNFQQQKQQQQQQFPQQQLPGQQMMPTQQQQLLNQQILPNQQQMLPTQQQQLDPNHYQMSPPPSSSSPAVMTFQNGQTYPTLDPQFSVQAQVSPGTRGAGKSDINRRIALNLLDCSCDAHWSYHELVAVHRNRYQQ